MLKPVSAERGLGEVCCLHPDFPLNSPLILLCVWRLCQAGTALETRDGGEAPHLPPTLLHGGKLKGKEKTILDYFVPLAVRMGCLFVLGGLPDRGCFFSLLLFPSEIKIFLQELPGGFVIAPTCLLQDGCAHWGALTGGVERMVRVERMENPRDILELQGVGMVFLCWVQHTRHQVITQDPRAGQEQFAVKSFSLNTPGEAGMSKIPAKAS